jgi:hypothetical protein
MGLFNPSSPVVNQTSDPVGSVWKGWCIDDFESYATGANPTLSGGIGWGGTAVMSGTNSIVSATDLAGNAKKRLQITNGEFIRRMEWGSKWKFIRIGMLLTIDHNATITSGGGVALGLCSGTSNGVKGTTTNFFGLHLSSGAAFPPVATWTRTAGTDHPFYTVPFYNVARKVSAGAWADLSTALSTSTPSAGADGLNALPICMEIRRELYGDTTYNWAVWSLTTTTGYGQRNFDANAFLSWMELRDFTNRSTYRAVAASTTANQSEGPGVFDSLNFATWEATRAIQLSCLAVQKVM